MKLESRLAKLEKQFEPFSFPLDLTKLSDEELLELKEKVKVEHAKEVGQKEADDFSNWIATLSNEGLDKLKDILNKLQYDPRRLPITTKRLQELML